METIRWQDDPAYKNLYDSEIGVLKRGLNGDFGLTGEMQTDPEGRIFCIGWIKITNNKRVPLKIIFPTKYPYAQPMVFPLLENPDGTIKDQAKMFIRGNQYGNGMMCLMRRDLWNKDEHNIGWTLRRSQKWLRSVLSPQGFKKEEIVEEIPSVLPHAGQVLIPRGLQLPENLDNGTILFTQFKPNYYILHQNFIQDNPFKLQVGQEQFTWFRMPKGKTFRNFVDNNLQLLLQYFTQVGILPQQLPGKSLALFIPDDPNQWHFIKIAALGANQFQIAYFLSRNVDRELYHRTKDIFDDVVLKQKRLTIIGLGALGSEAARSLARNGVGHFNFFDNDTFEIGNSVRHAADLFYIGENKVDVVRQLVQRSNPNITVNAYPVDVLNDNGLLEASLSQSDLCIVLTADDNVDYLINDKYISRFNIPFIFARVSAGGLSGSVQIVRSGETACLRCLSLCNADTLPVPNQTNRYGELALEYGSCSTPAVAGSEIDTKEIALQVSRICLQLLLTGSTYAPRQGDQFYWHGPFGSGTADPFTWEIKKLEKHINCAYCNK
jgi:molybdopterin/thiamine biosynthesis adenylyltransferase